MIVPFGKFRPDQSRFNPSVTTSVVNVRPTPDGWGPLRALSVISDALPAEPRGAIAVRSNSGVWRIFAGTATNLYRINSADYSWDEVSRATDDYSLAAGEFWSFEQWGNYLVATAVGSDFPQFYDLSSGAVDFANLTNASFEARYVKAIGDFLVFACIDGDNTAMKWSGINDFTSWTEGIDGSDTQTHPTGGDIQGMIGQAANGLVFQSDAIKQILFSPDSGVVFTFATVNPDRGVYAPRSIVNIAAGDFVYLAKNGFFRGVDSRPIGSQRVDQWFFSVVGDATLVSGVRDPFLKIIWWRFPLAAGGNAMLGYDYQLDEWLYSTNAPTELLEAATIGYTLENLDAFGTIDSLPYSLDSRFWKGGLPGFAGFDSTYKFGFFDGDNLEALIETEDKMLNYPRRAITGGADGQGIQLLADTNMAQLAIATKETQDGALMYGNYLTQESGLPWFSSRVSGKWHRFRVKIPANSTWRKATGLDVPFTDGGMR